MRKADQRKQEILSATTKLYDRIGYREITLQKIAGVTSMSRPSIYNYFETKEEIFLALLEEEYRCWAHELDGLLADKQLGELDYFAHKLADSIADRKLMLKLIANNITDFEENSRFSQITSFKEAYGLTLTSMAALFERVLPGRSVKERQDLLYSFMPFLYGLYPYAEVTDKQRQGLEDAAVDFHFYSVQDLVYQLVIHLLQ